MSAVRVEPEYVVAEIRRALVEDPELAELGIDALVVGETIVLHGRIATHERRTRAGEVVRRLFPSHEVKNEIALLELAPGGAPEPIG